MNRLGSSLSPARAGPSRSAPLAMIHIGKAQLGLDEETYRSLLERVTGKRSAKDLSENERKAVVARMRDLGFDPGLSRKKRGLDGPYAAKLQALWIAGWNLGVVRDRRDKALIAFVERQTGISHTRFLRFPEDAAKVIEALKGWLERAAGVDWSAPGPNAPAYLKDDRYRIVRAQLRRLEADDGNCQAIATKDFGSYESGDWIAVITALGEQVRGLGQ